MIDRKRIGIIFTSSAFAHDDGGEVIGMNNGVPWLDKIPSHMDRFYRVTNGHSVMMGRKTWNFWDLFNSRSTLLLGRQIIVLTRDPTFVADDTVVVVHSPEEAVRLSKSETLWVAGGAKIFASVLPLADVIYQTRAFIRSDGDIFFCNCQKNLWQSHEYNILTAGEREAHADKVNSLFIEYRRVR